MYPVYSLKQSLPEKEISLLEHFFVFVLIIYAGQANNFVGSPSSFKESPIGVSIPILLSIFLAIKWNTKLNNRFFLLIGGLFLYFIAISIKFSDEIRPTIFINHFILFLITYIVIDVLEFNFFKLYEEVIRYLALIALFFWSVQIVLRGDTLYNLIEKIPGIDSFSSVSGSVSGVNIIIYSVQSSFSSIIHNSPLPRNCGFAWEPGGFAVYLCLAIFINLFIINQCKKFDSHFWILSIALLSTQSTTGYSIFILLMLFYYFNKKSIAIFLFLPLVIGAVILFFSLPFMTDKIINIFNSTNDTNYLIWESIGNETTLNPQRFTSFVISFRDFLQNPILGNAGIAGTSWYQKMGANIGVISGIGTLLSMFGIVGFLFFSIVSLRTSFLLSKYFNYKGRFLLFLIILFISISYSIIFVPLIMSFWIFGYFAKLPVNPKRFTSF